MRVRCTECSYEIDSHYRFCGMCGAELPTPQPTPETEERTAQSRPARDQVSSISGPSFLGLADESNSTAAYLLEDDMSTSHWGRAVVLVGILGCVTAAAWHWRHDLRGWAAKFSHQPGATQTEQVSHSASPISTSGSKAAEPSAQTFSENPTTESTTRPGGQPKPSSIAAGQANTLAAAEPITQPSVAQPEAQTPVAGTPSIIRPASKKDEPSAPTGSFAEERPTKESTTLPSGPGVEAVASSSAGDALEVEGERYLYGTGSPANCARAQRDLLAAAERSNAKGESVLGTMYATGHCVPRDLSLAYRWFAKALGQDPGNVRFQRDLQVLWNQMTPDERQTAMHHQ